MMRPPRAVGGRRVAVVVSLAVALLAASGAGAQNRYQQHNLVSDIAGLAYYLDPQLVNPWGLSASGSGPFWVSNAGTGTSTIYNTFGVKQPLVVTIPPAPGSTDQAAPTGQVFNNANAFSLGNGSNAVFLFATENGTIAGWNGAAGTTALNMVDNSPSDAIYKGLAISGSGATARLYAANFHAGTVDVWDGGFSQLFGGFVDPTLPAGYAPFNVQNIAGKIYVTYALQDADAEDDVPGAGHGFVDVFDTNGGFMQRLVSGGVLDSPWGVAMAPAGFGLFSNALLVGNFGDGRINAFDPSSGAFLGALTTSLGDPIEIDGLWALRFGNGGNGGDPNTLYFTAGLDDEAHGLFGSVSSVPEPAAVLLVATGLLGISFVRRRRA